MHRCEKTLDESRFRKCVQMAPSSIMICEGEMKIMEY